VRSQSTPHRPRVLLVGRTRYEVPFGVGEARKFNALDDVMSWHVLARSAGRRYEDDRATLLGSFPLRLLDGLVFHARLPFATLGLIRRLRPRAIVAQDPFTGAAVLIARRLARSRQAVIVEVHGDWRSATRLYGSKLRRLLALPADAIAAAALRRADAVRAVSGYTARLVREVRGSVEAQFPTFLDLEPFRSTPPAPPPERPTALFVGALERYKNIDGVLAAWVHVHARVPEARLAIVGSGRLAHHVKRAARADASIEYLHGLSHEGVLAALDMSTCLVLPSRSGGKGRVVLEAMARARPVIASRTGVQPELVRDGVNGVLVAPDRQQELEEALIVLLTNAKVSTQLGANAAARAATEPGPAAFSRSLLTLVNEALQSRDGEPFSTSEVAVLPRSERSR
jgi:glycosyltransferase involved in cell wall biosynthesis